MAELNSSAVCNQCDQILKHKVAQVFPKVALKVASQFCLKTHGLHNCPKSYQTFGLLL